MSADPKAWLRKRLSNNAQENATVRSILNLKQHESEAQPSEDNITDDYLNTQRGHGTDSDESLTKLSYENENLKLVVDKIDHRQEKRFRLQDHLFAMRIEAKKGQMPLLSDILSFLHSAFLFIILKIKKFYNPNDRNIAFMTLHQSSLTNSLNTSWL